MLKTVSTNKLNLQVNFFEYEYNAKKLMSLLCLIYDAEEFHRMRPGSCFCRCDTELEEGSGVGLEKVAKRRKLASNTRSFYPLVPINSHLDFGIQR